MPKLTKDQQISYLQREVDNYEKHREERKTLLWIIQMQRELIEDLQEKDRNKTEFTMEQVQTVVKEVWREQEKAKEEAQNYKKEDDLPF